MFDPIIDGLRAAPHQGGNATTLFDEQKIFQEHFGRWMKGDTPPFSSFILNVFSFTVFGLAIAALRYTLWCVIGTLALVEAPQVIIRTASDKPTGEGDSPVLVPEQTTITRSIRGTLRLLYNKAGILGFWRGAAVIIPYGYSSTLVQAGSNAVLDLVPGLLWDEIKEHGSMSTFLACSVEILIASILLAGFPVALTHIIITEPTDKNWFRRLLPFPFLSAAKALWVPVLVDVVASRLTFRLPIALLETCGIVKGGVEGNPSVGSAHFRRRAIICVVWLAAQALRLGLLFPALVARNRVEASLLPNDEETIIPVDRSFGKRSAPGILAKTGPISFRAAWKSFDGVDKVRIGTLFTKFVLIEVAMRGMFTVFIGREAWPSLDFLNLSLGG